MKIAYITTIGGSLKFFKSQMKNQSENGFEVYAISSPYDEFKSTIGENIVHIPIKIARGISPLTLWKSISDLTKVFKEYKFDVVQYGTPNAAFVASIAAKRAKIKVRNYHLMGIRYLGAKGILRKLLKLIEKISCKNSTHIECVSKSNLEHCVKEKIFPRDKAVVIWHGSSSGVDMERFDINNRAKWREEKRKELGLSENEFVFGFAGRITRDKGINELLEAFEGIHNSKLLIAGNNEGIDTLNQETYKRALQNEKIKFLGRVSDIEKFYAAIDVFVLPSYREGLGNVIIEAGAMGTPAIITDIPGPIDAVNPGVSALLIKARDMQSLRDAMLKFENDPEKIKTMSEQAYLFVKESFDSKVLDEKMLERKKYLMSLAKD